MKAWLIFNDEGSYSSRDWQPICICLTKQGAMEMAEKLERLTKMRGERDRLRAEIAGAFGPWSNQSAALRVAAEKDPRFVTLCEEQARYVGMLQDQGCALKDRPDPTWWADASFDWVELEVFS